MYKRKLANMDPLSLAHNTAQVIYFGRPTGSQMLGADLQPNAGILFEVFKQHKQVDLQLILDSITSKDPNIEILPFE